MSDTVETRSSRIVARGVREGIGYGILAGAVFALAQVAAATQVGEPASAPLRQMAGLALGPGARSAEIAIAVLIGAFVNVVLSGACGLGFGLVSLAEPEAMRRRPGVQLLLGAIYGGLLWLVDDVLVAPHAYPWFLDASPGWQLVLHVVCFGAPLGIMSAASERAARRIEEASP
jgi:hypothetical protein